MTTYRDLLGIDPDNALITDPDTGCAAHVVPDTDPMTPDDWAEGEDWSEAWNLLERGEVYGIVILDPDGEHADSCWGFYEAFSIYDPDSYIRAESTAMLQSAVDTYRSSTLWVTI